MNPDKALIEEGLRIADNDTAILLRSLVMTIQKFEVNRLNDSNTEKVLEDIIETGKDSEEKMNEKFRDGYECN